MGWYNCPNIPHVGIIFVHHGGVMPMVKDWCGCFDINIMGIFGWLFFMLKWMIIFDVEVDDYFCTVTGLCR